jgi:hypothetical protein
MVPGWVPFKIVSDSSALHSRWPLLLRIEISSNSQNCSILSQNVPKFELCKHNDELFSVYYRRTQFWKGAIQESFQQSLVDIGSVVSEEKNFKKFHPPFSSSSMDSSVSLLSLLFSSPIDSSLEDSLTRVAPSDLTRPSELLDSRGSSLTSLVKFEGASQGYEFSSEESEGEETNREVEDDPPDSSSLEGRVKYEGASQGNEFYS